MGEKENGVEHNTADSTEEGPELCLRCGAPVETVGEMLCKKCEREVH